MSGRTNWLLGGAAVLVVALFVSTNVASQEKTQSSEQGAPAGMMAEMAKWAALNQKCEEHEKFAEMVGTWKTQMKMWMAPGVPPMESEGEATFKLIMDGRYIEQTYKCNMMGAPYVGRGIEGFDRTRKKFVSIWIDNVGTGISMSEGVLNANGDVVYYGKMDDVVSGELGKTVKSVAHSVSDDEVVFTMYDQRHGIGEFKSMEITYTRE